jgi:hypothetical protein
MWEAKQNGLLETLGYLKREAPLTIPNREDSRGRITADGEVSTGGAGEAGGGLPAKSPHRPPLDNWTGSGLLHHCGIEISVMILLHSDQRE